MTAGSISICRHSESQTVPVTSWLLSLSPLDRGHTRSRTATRLSSSTHAGWVSASLRRPLGPAGPLIFSQATCVSLISIWLWGYSRSHSRTRQGQMHRAASLIQSIFHLKRLDQRKTNVKHYSLKSVKMSFRIFIYLTLNWQKQRIHIFLQMCKGNLQFTRDIMVCCDSNPETSN